LIEQCIKINDGKPIKAEEDLFNQGFDSLSATFLRNRIRGALGSVNKTNAHQVDQNFVFTHSSIDELAAVFYSLSQNSQLAAGFDREVHVHAIEEMVAKYSHGLADKAFKSKKSQHKAIVLLTGSTGGLGSYLLATLLQHEGVQRVYALNRRSSSASPLFDRQRFSFQEKGFDVCLLASDKLVLVEGDMSDPGLGLNSNLFREVGKCIVARPRFV
jgi:hypothetical protein